MKVHGFLFLASMFFAVGTCNATCDDAGSTPGDFPFASEQAVSSFLEKLQLATSHNEKEAVAELVHFPVRATVNGKQVGLDRASFMSHFNEVFNQKVLAAISAARFKTKADYGCVFWNDQGMMLGDGEIWFNAVQDGIKIITVNNS